MIVLAKLQGCSSDPGVAGESPTAQTAGTLSPTGETAQAAQSDAEVSAGTTPRSVASDASGSAQTANTEERTDNVATTDFAELTDVTMNGPGAEDASVPQAVADGEPANASGPGASSGAGVMPSVATDTNAPSSDCGPVQQPVPVAVVADLSLDPFYRKYVDAGGLPILASAAPDDAALTAACRLVNDMLAQRDDVRQALVRNRARFAIIGRDEGTADIPEYGYRDGPEAEIDRINQRARGLGGQVASCGEENMLCLEGDRYWDESICVHEFAHTISVYGLYAADRTFESRLRDTFEHSVSLGRLEQTYRRENMQEYWAEGVQDWYDTNAEAIPSNGIHNEINTREELASYDPELYRLIAELLSESTEFDDCHRK